MGYSRYRIGSDTLVNFTLDELVGGIALIAIGLLMAVAIFGLEMISFESMAINLTVVALLIGSGIYVYLGMPLNNIVLILAAVVLVPFSVLVFIGSGMAPTSGTENIVTLLLAGATLVVVLTGAVDALEEFA